MSHRRCLPIMALVCCFALLVPSTLKAENRSAAPSKLPGVDPESVGFDSRKLERIDELVASALAEGKMPGCVVMIGRRGGIAFFKAYGDRQQEPDRQPMTVDTVFDLASLTKPIATAASVMLLCERGRIDLDSPVSRYLPEFSSHGKDRITARQLLIHQSGLLADNPVEDYELGPDEAWRRIDGLEMLFEPGARFLYTDVGFLVLGRLVERVSGQPLSSFVRDNLYAPLGMTETGYLPEASLQQRAAPTEKRNGEPIRGEVHDPRAYALGGVAGHAGLFSTAADLAVFAQMLISQGEYAGVRVMAPETVHLMTQPAKVSSGWRCLGWDMRTGYSSNRAKNFSGRAFGHGGFTGTVLWIDPELEMFFIFLSNRLHPDGKGLVNPLAGEIATAAVEALEEGVRSKILTVLEDPAPAGEAPPTFLEGLGPHRRPVTSSSVEAQRYFDQGLNLLYAFNHDEAIRSFRAAAAIDPRCPMAWWGVALALGPHINNPIMSAENSSQAWEALQKARESAARGNEVERDLIAALEKRYANPPPEDRRSLDEAYAAAMRTLARKYADDADVGALFAESLMDLRPWDLWTAEGDPQPGTEEVVAVLEGVLARSPRHPLGLHLMIHAVEASRHPEKADAAADRLRDLAPGLGHLVHMPSHIDVRRGRWQAAIVANEKAIEADDRYQQQSPRQDFYRIYMAHNHHMLCYAAMMRGQSAKSIEAIQKMAAGIPEDWLKENAPLADGFTAMPLEVLVRFGRWDEVLAAPEPAEYLPIARAMWRCARGIAFAAKGDVPAAREEQAAFLAARAAVPEEAVFGNNKAADLLAVAEQLLAGEIDYREGKTEAAIASLREAVRREDALRYAEPPDWIHPVRHALGAILLDQRRAAEAEQVYREDLARLPENGWSLYGLSQSLKMQDRLAEAIEIQERFEKAWADADIEITSSCYCQPAR